MIQIEGMSHVEVTRTVWEGQCPVCKYRLPDHSAGCPTSTSLRHDMIVQYESALADVDAERAGLQGLGDRL